MMEKPSAVKLEALGRRGEERTVTYSVRAVNGSKSILSWHNDWILLGEADVVRDGLGALREVALDESAGGVARRDDEGLSNGERAVERNICISFLRQGSLQHIQAH